MSHANIKRPPMVEVLWFDACGWAQWADRDEHAKGTPMPCVSVGHLLSKSDKQVVVALNLSAKNADSSITIPRSWVKRIRRLK